MQLFHKLAITLSCLLCYSETVFAREPIRVVAIDSTGKEIFSVEQVYNGKQAKNPNTKPSRDPEKFETDFYQITYRNLSSEPITIKRLALGVRWGAGTIVGVKTDNQADSWGAGLQERDLTLQPMFDKNILAGGKSQTGEYFISTNGINFIDRVIQIEHLGKTYELKWEMKFSKGD